MDSIKRKQCTLSQIRKVIKLINTAVINIHGLFIFIFVDYKKAFDKVKRQKLVYILKEKNIPNLLLKKIYWKFIQIT
jgi:hypothetical protein